ncbi:MAG: 3-phosphoglycerate dehydrogenase [Pedobacter sp.]|nr:MAG: 3-phosphoglycerate dehydrogenase [Pedobacter sp.]
MTYKLLANDGIDPIGKIKLEEAGIIVDTNSVPQAELLNVLPNYDAITVRSATKIRQDLIDACPNLKVIGRGGVGMDNIDVEYAKEKGIAVVNTPAASSHSVAELVFSHLFTGVRFLYDSNREMPLKGASNFNELKKKYAKGSELSGKVLGIIGFGRIGREVGKIALGLGMHVYAYDINEVPAELSLNFANGATISLPIKSASLDEIFVNADFISVHTPFMEKPIIDEQAFSKMKDGVGIVNCSRGGIICEESLINALNAEKVSFAGLDVFENEPKPSNAILAHPKVSLSPHIGASTNEAQERIGLELAELIINSLKNRS